MVSQFKNSLPILFRVSALAAIFLSAAATAEEFSLPTLTERWGMDTGKYAASYTDEDATLFAKPEETILDLNHESYDLWGVTLTEDKMGAIQRRYEETRKAVRSDDPAAGIITVIFVNGAEPYTPKGLSLTAKSQKLPDVNGTVSVTTASLEHQF